MAEPSVVRTTERWFIRQGLPLFVEEYSAGRDVWTRAVPVLAFLFVLGIFFFVFREGREFLFTKLDIWQFLTTLLSEHTTAEAFDIIRERTLGGLARPPHVRPGPSALRDPVAAGGMLVAACTGGIKGIFVTDIEVGG